MKIILLSSLSGLRTINSMSGLKTFFQFICGMKHSLVRLHCMNVFILFGPKVKKHTSAARPVT